MHRLLNHLHVWLSLPLIASAGAPTPLESPISKNPKQPADAAVIPVQPTGWTLGAGFQWRQMGEASFHGGRLKGPSLLPPAANTYRGSTRYRDGFVSPDSTGGAQTWNWGYNSASQVSGNNLTLSGTSTQIISRTLTSGSHMEDAEDPSGLGFYLSIESPDLVQWSHLSLSTALGYSFAQDEAGSSGIAYRAERQVIERSQSLLDVYDISAITPLPTAPYSGTFSGPGPVISMAPASRNRSSVTERLLFSEVFTSHLDQSLDLQLHTFSLGPRVGFDLGRFHLQAGLGLAINIVPWDFDSRETFRSNRRGTLKTWTTSDSGTDILPGLYAELAAQYRLTKRWHINTGVRYDWSQSLEGQVAGTTFDVDLGGWTATLGIGWDF
jgi:hypothetical protein